LERNFEQLRCTYVKCRIKWLEEIGGCGGGSCVKFEDGGVRHLDQMKVLVMAVMEGNHRVFHSHNIASHLIRWLRFRHFFLFLLYIKYPFIFDMFLPFFLVVFQNNISIMLKQLFSLKIPFWCLCIYVIKTNLMYYLSSVYFVIQPLHVSGIIVAHHEEVYCIYTTIGTCAEKRDV
jgi:hypothetical protein